MRELRSSGSVGGGVRPSSRAALSRKQFNRLKKHYDAWWVDIQPHLVNDDLTDVPETHKSFRDLYRESLGQERFDAAMRTMTWSHESPRKKKP